MRLKQPVLSLGMWMALGVGCSQSTPSSDAGLPPDASVDGGLGDGGTDGGASDAGPPDAGDAGPFIGLVWPWPIATYEAESGLLGGGASVVGAADGSDRAVGDLGGEASGRRAVVLTAAADTVSWVIRAAQAGANAIVIRFSIPDAPDGGGAPGTLDLLVTNAQGVRYQTTIALTSRYAWLYGGPNSGTSLYNSAAYARAYAPAPTHATHLYDEIQKMLPLTLASGDSVGLRKGGSPSATVAIDFIDLETVPAPLPQPPNYVSVTDARCGAIPFDLRGTGQAFDGADDSSYGSVFNATLGFNLANPPSFRVREKDSYSTAPGDPLHDNAPNPDAGGLSMFQLADHNLSSLASCIALVTGGSAQGVWIPPGRFYVRGALRLPSNVAIRGAGMWYSKFVAVDTQAPTAVGDGGVSADGGPPDVSAVTGNVIFGSQAGGADGVALSDFSIFGNVTQRDVVDSVIPDGVHGTFTHSAISGLWVEHTFSGLKTLGASSAVAMSYSRARNEFADGIDFYGYTASSTIHGCEARSNGDDGFAMWAQGDDVDAGAVSRANRLSNCVSRLSWWGNGFAVYGGVGTSVTGSVAADPLNYPCLQVSTNFVPATILSSDRMSATASSLRLYRCGGNGFGQAYGALLVGVDTEDVDGIAIDHVDIDSPTFSALDFRPINDAASLHSIRNVTLSQIEVLDAGTCAQVQANAPSSAALDDVCACATPSGSPAACGVTNATPSAFQIAANTCLSTACFGF